MIYLFKSYLGDIFLKKRLIDLYRVGVVGIVIADYDTGYIEYANDLFLEGLGYSIDEIRSRPFIEFVHEGDVESTIGAINRLSKRPTIIFTNRYNTKNGGFQTIKWTAAVKDGKYLCRTEFV